MADFGFARDTHTQGVEVDRVFVGGEEAAFVFGLGTQIFPNLPIPFYGSTEVRMNQEADAKWFDFGFRIDAELTGNAAAGWTDPGNYCRLEIQYSTDLVNWSMGKFLPAATPVVDLEDGTFEYWGRCVIPQHWEDIMIDLTASSNRYGKSITGLTVMMTPVSLPNYPYAMPADAAQLQTDLRAAGFDGATVTSSAASITATARNHIEGSVPVIHLTQSGGDVTAATYGGSPVSLPSYPYALPGDAAALQADLRTAGLTGAVVMLYGDEWEIFLPDRVATGTVRDFSVTIDPGDPFPYWDFFGAYQGLNPANVVAGESGNVRTPTGTPLEEYARQFARLKITAGTRYDPYL